MLDLKKQAKELGIKQSTLALNLGVSEGTMSRWLNRQGDIPTEFLRPMSQRLQVPIEELLPPIEVLTPSTTPWTPDNEGLLYMMAYMVASIYRRHYNTSDHDTAAWIFEFNAVVMAYIHETPDA